MAKEWVNNGAMIKVIGVGGGGNNAVNRMLENDMKNVEFIVANTDMQVLNASGIDKKLILGEATCKGLGAGADPEIGKKAAIEAEDEIKEALQGAELVFIAAGMGGGTGTGAAPVIAKIARELGALTIGIVTKPFRFEGKKRVNFANEGIEELQKNVDSMIIVSNDRLLELTGNIPAKESFREADNILRQGVQTITDLIAIPSQINLDFADVKNVMKNKGKALFGIGVGSGDGGAVEAAKKAINSSLLDTSIRGAKDAIVNVTGGSKITLNDVYAAVNVIEEAAGEDLNIVFGMATNDELKDNIVVTIIATGFDENLESNENEELDFSQQTVNEPQQTSATDMDEEVEMVESDYDLDEEDEAEEDISFGDLTEEEVLEATMTNFTFNNEDNDIPSFVKHK
ncbi:cell division protein FtsZ [Mesoplasma lactucae]|uniref:Cell division protein FtsZ n=1 Tax=Mesoplasma lactucae ATCC 49193 TaxID=81460 RepID=A0A291IRB6_9MOLU|nr:cell division protein FtsZ [Mesoplasma lactucae]ATG97485.1 cell division protein FtsZ [Mesoplasma lactucae ATCC 49193]ATZ20060.1 cell division protein FtsZ [Mesoplasma lactucae ATCC 49193]MCL8216808.1 Cell division protein FtsZ [Mesoplasma lactucae ATCC 49193]